MNALCLYCQRALGCPLLFGKDGRFDAERLITEEKPKECPKFEEVLGAREKNVRDRMYKSFGLGYLRALHELPELVMAGLRQGEKDELMYDNVPNFQDPKLLWEGMTSLEREDVLRHQTDESGNIIVETDKEGVSHKLARPEYHLKGYLCDPDGPIKASKPVAWMWHINQIVDHIIKTEAEQGFIVKVKKPSTPVDETDTVDQTEQPQQESEITMATTGRQVRTVRTGAPAAAAAPAAAPARAAAAPAAKTATRPGTAAPAPAHRAQPKPVAAAPAAAAKSVARPPTAAAPAASVAGTGKVANPPARRVATPAGAPGRPAAAPAAAAKPAAVAPAAVTEIDPEIIEAAVFKVVNPMFEELLNQVKQSIQTTIDVATILGDIAGQTGGRFQVEKVNEDGNYVVREDGTFVMEAPQLWTHPSKIFAHVEGTGFDPGNLHTIKTPADPPDEDAMAEEAPAEEEVQEGEA